MLSLLNQFFLKARLDDGVVSHYTRNIVSLGQRVEEVLWDVRYGVRTNGIMGVESYINQRVHISLFSNCQLIAIYALIDHDPAFPAQSSYGWNNAIPFSC